MTRFYYDITNRMRKFDIKHGANGAYFVYLDDKFYCSADTYEEADQDIDECIDKLKGKTLFEII